MAWISKPYERVRRKMLDRLASSHVAGPHLEDALWVLRKARARGWRATLSPWKGPDETTKELCARYHRTLCAIIDDRLHGTIMSVKPKDLVYDFRHLADLLHLASTNDIPIYFDSQDLDGVSHSFALLERARAVYDRLGCTLPARWKRSFVDAEHAIDLQLAVRVVKGQFIDSNEPPVDCRKRFLELIRALAGRAAHVSVATHDAPLANEALSILRDAGTPCELEQLVNLPKKAIRHAEAKEIPVRIYIPFGHPYIPYRVRDVVQRPAITQWILRDLIGQQKVVL